MCFRRMGFQHLTLILVIICPGSWATTCDPPPSSTWSTNIMGTAHVGRTSVSAGESFSYTCVTTSGHDWQPGCPNTDYPPNAAEDYKITCLGNNKWDYVSSGCCPSDIEKGYVGCYSTTAGLSFDYSYYHVHGIRMTCQQNGEKYLIVDQGNSATTCLTATEFDNLNPTAAPDQCTSFNDIGHTFMGDTLSGGVGVADQFSVYESFYGCYSISDTSWFINNAQYSKTGWTSMKEGDCNSYCTRMFGDKKVYTVAYKTNECYCVDTDLPDTTAVLECTDGITFHWDECQEPCAGDNTFTLTGCGSSTHAVVQHTDATIPYGKDENCFTLFNDHKITEHGYYKFQEGVRYCAFYDGTYCDQGWLGFNGECYLLVPSYSTAEFDDAELKCADEYDGHLISILDCTSDKVEYWTSEFLKVFMSGSNVADNTDIWIGGFDHYGGSTGHSGGQNFMWLDGTIVYEYPPQYDLSDFEGQCLYLSVTTSDDITMKNGPCSSTSAKQVMCKRPSEVRDGVRSYGCWNKRPKYMGTESISMPTAEGLHADLTTDPPALQRDKPWTLCEGAISSLHSDPTVFGINDGECFGNETGGYVYMTGLASTDCKGGYGSSTSFNIYESGDIPRGYLGCYDVNAVGDFTTTDSDMTVTACREICFARGGAMYDYNYAAVKGSECHCFADFHSKNGGTRSKLSACDSFCPANGKQRCGNSAGTAYVLYSSVKYYPFMRTCVDAGYQLLPSSQKYRIINYHFWSYDRKLTKQTCSAAKMLRNANCPDNTWLESEDGQCVKLSSAVTTRDDAQTFCRRQGGDLFRPITTEDLDNVVAIRNQIRLFRGGDHSSRIGAAHAQASVLDIMWADGGWPDSLKKPIYDPYGISGITPQITGTWKNPYNDKWNNVCVPWKTKNMFNCKETNLYRFACSIPQSGSEVYIGCYSETAMKDSTLISPVSRDGGMHVTRCIQTCLVAGIKYAMLTGEFCRCVASLTGFTKLDRIDNCGDGCPGMHLQDCGKVSSNTSSVYDTGTSKPPTSCTWYQSGGLVPAGQYLIDPDGSEGDTAQYKTQCNSFDNSASCPTGWISFKGHCYMFSSDTKSYDDAYTTCLASDALLLSPSRSYDEIEFIEKLIRADPALSSTDMFYVGLYQLDADTFPGTTDYVYLDSGTITDDHNLHDDWEDQGNPPCFAWRTSDMKLFPVGCDDARRYICRSDSHEEMMCTSQISSAPEYTVTNHRMSNTLCRLICQGKQYDYAATNLETCSCYNKTAISSSTALGLAECDIPCPTIKYQRCGGTGDKVLVTHSHPECPASFSFLSGSYCYGALDISVNFWEGADGCSFLYGKDVGLADSLCTECKALSTELGKDLWINPYRRTSSDTDFYSAPISKLLNNWADDALDLSVDGRCSALTSSGRRLADCDAESLSPFCYKKKGPTITQVSSKNDVRDYGIGESFTLFYGSNNFKAQGVQALEKYCREGSAWFADFTGNCYTYVPVTSTDQFLTACRDIGAPRAVINTRDDDDWLLELRSKSRPLSTLYANQRAITGTFDYNGNGNLVSMDGTYWSGTMHNLRSDSYLSAYVTQLWDAHQDDLMHGPYINHKEDGSDLFVAEFASNMQGVLCERSRAYQGCYSIAGQTLFKAYQVDYQPNTVYQCVETCRALDYSFIAITGSVCYCTDEVLGTYEADQAACMGQCSNTNLAVDLCGNSGLSTAIYINITDSDYDLLATTCTDLYNEGATLSGTYKLSLSGSLSTFYCHADGEEYGIPLTGGDNLTISASSHVIERLADHARIHSMSSWVASSDTDQWWQVAFSTPHIITAILCQGNGIDTGTVQLYYGSFAGSFTLEVGLNVSDTSSWYSYKSKYMLDGAESRGEVVKTYLSNPPIGRVVRLSFPSSHNGYDIAGRFELIGYPYSLVNDAHVNAASFAGHTYYMSYTTMTYTEAQIFCSSTIVGGYLAVPDDQEEQDFILEHRSDKLPHSTYAWIGVSDSETEGHFLTSAGLSPLFTNWAASQPSSTPAHDCVRLDGAGEWEAIDCSSALQTALCEVNFPQPSAGAQPLLGCYLDVYTDESLFYPAEASSSAEECAEACFQSGHMFASFNSTGDTSVDTPLYFSEEVDEAYVSLVPALDGLTELTVCLIYLMADTAEAKDRCFLGSDTTTFRLCKRGDNSDEYYYYNSHTGADSRIHISAEGWIPVCLASGLNEVSIHIGESGSTSLVQNITGTTTLATGTKILLGQGSTNIYVGATDNSTERFYGSIRRVNAWDRALSNTDIAKYMDGQIFGNIVNSDDPANWPTQLDMSHNVRIQTLPPVLSTIDLSELTITASSEESNAKATDIRLSDERIDSGGDSGGGWCADKTDGTDETWKAEFEISYTIYSVMLKPRSSFYPSGESGRITSFEILHSNGICIGAFPSCTTFEVTAADYIVTLPYPITTRDISIRIKGHDGKPCSRFEFYGLPSPHAGTMPANSQMYAGHLYHISASKMTYADAVAYCETALPGGYVALGDNADETNFIKTWKNIVSSGTPLWIGLTDIEEEGKFVDKDGLEPAYTDWYSGEPNDWGSGEDCTVFHVGDQWNDLSCSAHQYVLCESDAVPQPADVATNCECADRLGARISESYCSSSILPSTSGEAYRPIYRAWRSHCKAYGAITGVNITGYYNMSDFTPVTPANRYLGCWKADGDDVVSSMAYNSSSTTWQACVANCSAAGHVFAGLLDGEVCRCGNEYQAYGKAAETECNAACRGDGATMCGGAQRISVYTTGYDGITTDSLLKPQIPGTLLQFDCEHGYTVEITDGNDVTECDFITRKWTTTGFSCIPSECSSTAENMVNGTVVIGGNAYLDTITYICFEGHYFSDNTSAHTSVCQADETWTITQEQICERVQCPQPPGLNDATTNIRGTVFNFTVLYECDEGFAINPNFTLDGEAVVSTQLIRCSENGTWLPDVSDCLRVYCPSPPDVGNSSRIVHGLYYQDNTTYQCDAGYSSTPIAALTGSEVITEQVSVCQSNGSWSPLPQDCFIVECPTPPTLPNSNTDYNQTMYNSTASYECIVGTATNPQATLQTPRENVSLHQELRCAENGSWVPEVMNCQTVECPTPAPAGFTTQTINGQTYTSTVEYQCDVGYALNPNATWYDPPLPFLTSQISVCSAIGEWNTVDNCSIMLCPPLEPLLHGIPSTNVTEYNTTVTYSCVYGYKYNETLSPSDLSTICQDDGFWNQTVVDCIPNQCLEEPSPVANSYVSITSRHYDDVPANISCNYGYGFPDGSETISVNCTQSNLGYVTWAEPQYTACERVKCDLPTLNCTEELVRNSAINSTSYYYEDRVTLTTDRHMVYAVLSYDGTSYRSRTITLSCLHREWDAIFINCTSRLIHHSVSSTPVSLLCNICVGSHRLLWLCCNVMCNVI